MQPLSGAGERSWDCHRRDGRQWGAAVIEAEQREVGWGWGSLPPWTVSAPRNWTALIGGAEECLLSEFMFFENTRRISMTSSEEKSGFRPLSLTNDELR